MIVYHGSYCIVDNPQISYSREYLDFGKGFYITEIEDQVTNWTNKFKKRGKNGYLNIYSLDIDNVREFYRVKEFLSYDLEWLDFILGCRAGNSIYLDYDMIIGGIADDRVYNTIELYQDGLIEKDEALKKLKYYKPNHQICIVNQGIIDKYLKYEESKEV
ncbi:MAG: DUF3990 domain-containing protein [Clostridiaceae bacterium]